MADHLINDASEPGREPRTNYKTPFSLRPLDQYADSRKRKAFLFPYCQAKIKWLEKNTFAHFIPLRAEAAPNPTTLQLCTLLTNKCNWSCRERLTYAMARSAHNLPHPSQLSSPQRHDTHDAPAIVCWR